MLWFFPTNYPKNTRFLEFIYLTKNISWNLAALTDMQFVVRQAAIGRIPWPGSAGSRTFLWPVVSSSHRPLLSVFLQIHRHLMITCGNLSRVYTGNFGRQFFPKSPSARSKAILGIRNFPISQNRLPKSAPKAASVNQALSPVSFWIGSSSF